MLKASCGAVQPITFMYNGPCAKPTEQGRQKLNETKQNKNIHKNPKQF
jgi:hypothetical protein